MPENQDGIINKKITLGDNGDAANILGEQDSHLAVLEKELDAKIVVRGDEVFLSGKEKDIVEAERVFKHLTGLSKNGVDINILDINYALSTKDLNEEALAEYLSKTVYVTPKGKQIKAKSVGQWRYMKNIHQYDLVFAIGPAGTGKTYLAVIQAVIALKKRQVAKIVLARPAVEAGEKLGFLPGDLQEKVNPYLRPVYDALDDILGQEMAAKYVERNIIEVVPLAYMRGRTLENAFIILDEAQNTTPEQMKMLLTRLGLGSKAVVTGDITQIDLPAGQTSGLIQAESYLKGIEGITFSYFSKLDVVRHPLVQKIIEAYESKFI